VGKFLHLIERIELVSGEMCVKFCVEFRGIERGKIYTFVRDDRVSW
jgi:hypothetical protein